MEMEKTRHNAAYTEELQNRIKELDEGKGIVKTIAELEAMEKARHNAAYTEKLQNSIREIEEGNVIVKTIAELEAMENE